MHSKQVSTWEALLKVFLENHELLFSGVVLGHMPSGKNNYVLGKGGLRKNEEVVSYQSHAISQLRVLKRKNDNLSTIMGPVAMVTNVVNQSFRRDLDTILICDLLQDAGIVKNDRLIRMKLMNGIDVDKKNPRVEIRLFSLEGLDDLATIPA